MASIQQRPNGRWRARYLDPDGRERSRHFPTKTAAEDFLADQRVKLRDGTWIDPMRGRRTFGEYAEEWRRRQVHHRPSTVAATAQRLARIVDHYGDWPLASIDKADVQAWVSSLSPTYRPATVEALYRLLAQVMLAAKEEGCVAESPCRRINLPEREQRRAVVPSAETIAAVYAAAPEHARGLIVVGAGTGLRVSEVAGLTKDRVDFLRRTVTVDRQVVGTSAGRPRFGPPKTRASNRTVPVPQDLVDVMAEQLVRWPSPDVVFQTAHSRPWTRRTLTEEFRRWCGHAKVTGLTWHGLRHHYASGLIAAGLSVVAVADRLGHASTSETTETYGHLWRTDDDSTREAAGGLVASIMAAAEAESEHVQLPGMPS